MKRIINITKWRWLILRRHIMKSLPV